MSFRHLAPLGLLLIIVLQVAYLASISQDLLAVAHVKNNAATAGLAKETRGLNVNVNSSVKGRQRRREATDASKPVAPRTFIQPEEYEEPEYASDDKSSILPDSILQHLSPKVAKRFTRAALERRCKFERIAEFKAQSARKFNQTALKPVMWTCNDAQCMAGLGDQLRGMSSAFYQGLAVGFELVADWRWPVPMVPDIVTPRDTAGWSEAVAAMEAARDHHPEKMLRIDFNDDHHGRLCGWLNHSAVEFRGCLNYQPDGEKDCDFNAPPIATYVRGTSWAQQGIGCLFWHKFKLGPVLEAALAEALGRFRAWQGHTNRTGRRVVAVHVREGDKHFGGNRKYDGVENPFAARLRRVRSTMMRELLACAAERERRLAWHDVSYFVLADNNSSKTEALALRPGQVYASPELPVHPGQLPPGLRTGSLNSNGSGAGGHRPEAVRGEAVRGYIGMWVDLLMASMCDMVVVSASALRGFPWSTFSMAASELGLYPNATVVNGRECLYAKTMPRSKPKKKRL